MPFQRRIIEAIRLAISKQRTSCISFLMNAIVVSLVKPTVELQNSLLKASLFGFTGTPIFADNASKNDLGKRTTKDLFGNCLHKYVITDAIRDQNVLKFGIEYVVKYKHKSNTFIDIEVEAIDKKEVFDAPQTIGKNCRLHHRLPFS